MNKYNKRLLILIVSFVSGHILGMENEQTLSIIERRVMKEVIPHILFADHEKVLHIGSSCEKTIKKHAHDALEIYCISTNTLSMMNEPTMGYDKVLTFGCWDVVKNPRQAFKDSARVLKQNGLFCAVLPHCSPYVKIHYKTLENDRWKERYNKNELVTLYHIKKMREFLKKAGFSNVVGSTEKTPFIFKAKEDFMDWIAARPEHFVGISQEYHTAFINDLVNNYLRKFPAADDGSIKLFLSYMVLGGSKL